MGIDPSVAKRRSAPSGRSVEAFDLHAGLAACDGLLERWGGHRAAAGVTVRTENIDAFARAVFAPPDAKAAAAL